MNGQLYSSPPAPAPQHSFLTTDLSHAQAAATANAALAQGHPPQAGGNAMNGKKRKATGPGNRGVANLTAEQLAKKRANDREAQRAIRERTRNTIESLERRIRELEDQQPYRELQRVAAERDRALAECEELRKKLGAVAGIVGGQHSNLNDLAALTAQQSPLPTTSSQYPTPAYDESSDLRAQHSPAQTNSDCHTSSGQAFQDADGATHRWAPTVEQTAGHFYASNDNATYVAQTQSLTHHPQQSNGERHGLDFLLGPSKQTNDSSITPTNAASYHLPASQEQASVWAQLINVGPNSCPLDALLNDFHGSRRNMIREGASPLEARGPEYPSFGALMAKMADPDTSPSCDAVSGLLVDILSKFPDISKLPEKTAVLYIMFLIMRWIICPCRECFERLPEWCRPLKDQIQESHSVWVDYVPWPHMRRQLCLADNDVKFDDFFVPYTTTLSLNWKLPDECVLLSSPTSDLKQSGAVLINPAFEAHLRNLDNWSLGSKFSTTFPRLVDTSVRIQDG